MIIIWVIKLGNCSFIKRIGVGGGSNIYLAYHNSFGRQVVIKEYNYFQSKSELELLVSLKHPHIPSVYDYIEKNERTYLIMEYIEGSDLSYILRDGSLSEDKILKYAVQLCDTVEYLHSQEPLVMHGDIKPGNIIISVKDEVFLIDFNISLSFKNGIKTPIGYTIGYTAPEVFERNSKKKYRI